MSPFPEHFTQPWLEALESRPETHDFPDWPRQNYKSLITTSIPRQIINGTGLTIFERALLPGILSAKHSIHFVTCYWASSPSLKALSQTLSRLAGSRSRDSARLQITIGFSSAGLLQKLFHTSSRNGRVHPSSEWESLGLPDRTTLENGAIDLTVKSLFFTPFSVMHPKYVIVDETKAWVPSCNVSWERWFEGCVEVEGNVVQSLLHFHQHVWRMSTHTVSQRAESQQTLQPERSHTQTSSTSPMAYSSPTRVVQLDHETPVPTIFLPSSHHRNPKFRFFPLLSHDDPPMTPLNAALLTLFQKARREITVVTPNVTSWPVIDALLAALSRGVNVTIRTSKNMMVLEQLITAGTLTSWCLKRMVKQYRKRQAATADPERAIPKLGDLNILYYHLLESRAEAEDEPVLSHFKMTLVDGEFLVFGSGNMDRASWWTSQEIGILFHVPGFQAYQAWESLDQRSQVFYSSTKDLSAISAPQA